MVLIILGVPILTTLTVEIYILQKGAVATSSSTTVEKSSSDSTLGPRVTRHKAERGITKIAHSVELLRKCQKLK